MRRLINWLTLTGVDPAIARAQLGELQKHLPLLYSLVIANSALLAWTYLDLAPPWLTLGVFGILSVACLSRIPFWLRLGALNLTNKDVLRHLRRTVWLAGVVAFVCIGWAIMLDGYGGPNEQAHTAIFVATTIICSIFCLMHLPQAATVIVCTVSPLYLGYYSTAGVEPIFFAISLDVLLVVLVMLKVLFRAFDTFIAMIRSQAEIGARHDEVKKLNAENERLANTDALTGLTNRRHFFAELERWIGTDQSPFALALLDFDQFKPVNDEFGHAAGDRLLASIGERLGELCSADIVISRLGGDEFGILIRLDETAVDAFVQQARAVVTAPVQIGGNTLSVGCSSGVARFPQVAQTAEALFDRADQVLYQNKRAGSVTPEARAIV
jgi:diguanylate cyclase (GGDEF)-like protein